MNRVTEISTNYKMPVPDADGEVILITGKKSISFPISVLIFHLGTRY